VTLRNKFAALCVGLNAIVEVGAGVVYFTAREVMPYHKEVLGVDWGQLEPGVRTMLVAFINAYGSAHFAVGVALGALVLFPMRQGQAWARWAALGVGLPVVGGTAYIAARLAFVTGAGTPWQGALVLLVLFVLGIMLFQPKAAA